jgi:hypothetical protein
MDLAVAPLTTVLASPGVRPAAIFPEAFDAHIDMSLCLAVTAASSASAVRDLLLSPALDDELQAAGITRFALDGPDRTVRP